MRATNPTRHPDSQPRVGILSGQEIRFRLNGLFRDAITAYPPGEYIARRQGQTLLLSRDGTTTPLSPPLSLAPVDAASTFDLAGVTIGIDFHWEREEEQRFRGALEILDDGARLVAVNIVPLEDYLTSVISSEMRSTSSIELLKAHAVISRGWLLAQMEHARQHRENPPPVPRGGGEYTRWFDREDHHHFDVCADDHCQRYQGTARATSPMVARAVRETRGEVLLYNGELCDTRFSKCCGGATERFDLTWEPRFHPYLIKVDDNDDGAPSPDLTTEANARAWILSSPPASCNTRDRRVLANVLNDYDRETPDFFRWQVTYAADELTDLVERRLGAGLGDILALEPVARGVSGRLTRLAITGTRGRLVIGKELLIRRALSPTHLYSSAFIVDVDRHPPTRFTLRGAGWGHGVGLCQVGAAVMSERGYNYRQILARYFPGALLETFI
ncbi:MAG: SpoIID/LytB domain-containing protein [Odoribacteraceae bacterium]|jgi:SpoIID/LytB domain protein|nr:SpoIID/LytB domain-containing protein [Odoribacteraceae bacterium]